MLLCGSKYEIVCSVQYKIVIKTRLQCVYSVIHPACTRYVFFFSVWKHEI